MLQTQAARCQLLFEHLTGTFNQFNASFNVLFDARKLPIQLEANANVCLLVMHVYILLTTRRQGGLPDSVLRTLSEIIEQPASLANSFVPGLPHDEDIEIFEAFRQATKGGIKFYTCPNGHYYAVGECQKPMQTARCHSCNALIGGVDHVSLADNQQAADLTQKRQTGYTFLDAGQRDEANPSKIRNMSRLTSCVLRLLVDVAMFIAAKLKPTEANAALTVPFGDPAAAAPFYYAHVLKDVRVLANCMQHSPDESLLFVHHALNVMKRSPQPPINMWRTKDERINVSYMKRLLNDNYRK